MNHPSAEWNLEPAARQALAALFTPRGRGAVATVCFVGSCELIDAAPLFRAANRRPLAAQEIGRIVFGHWGEPPAEQVVVCRVNSSTVEIHCHGGDAAARRVLRQLESAGCAIVGSRECLERTEGLLAAELADTLARATTFRTAGILLEQSSGRLRNALVDLVQAAEQADSTTPLDAVRRRLDALLAWADFGLHLTQPWSVVLAGRPNVGKSSLINALVGYSRSIVFDQPGTTRDIVTAETAFDGWPVRLSDTAGLRSAPDGLEAAGIDRARQQLAAADCRVLLLDTSRPPEEFDPGLLADWPEALLVGHKSDLPDAWGAALPADALRVSSLTGAGVDELAAAIIGRLVPAIPDPETPIPVTGRQVRLLSEARQALNAGDVQALRFALKRCAGVAAVPSAPA